VRAHNGQKHKGPFANRCLQFLVLVLDIDYRRAMSKSKEFVGPCRALQPAGPACVRERGRVFGSGGAAARHTLCTSWNAGYNTYDMGLRAPASGTGTAWSNVESSSVLRSRSPTSATMYVS
jgi:hypothetical protein